MEKLLKMFIIVLSSLAGLLLLFATADTMMLQTQSGILVIIDKQVIERKTKLIPQRLGSVTTHVVRRIPEHLQLIGRLTTGGTATIELSTDAEDKFVIGGHYLCRYYVTRFTRAYIVVEIEAQ